MMDFRRALCPIWGRGREVEIHDRGLISYVVDSPRAGGGYAVDLGAKAFLAERVPDELKARLTTWIIDQRAQGIGWPLVERDVIERLDSALLPYKRADRLLKYIADSTASIGGWFGVPTRSAQFDGMLAHSESTTDNDVIYLVHYLAQVGFIEQNNTMGRISCRVTIEGYSHIGEQAGAVDSSQAFVAMWFDSSLDDAYEQGIRAAIEDAGYVAMRIDRKEHVNKIDDEIIAEIRRSRFVVADFTQGDSGARGGVYYEAGFAHGLNLPVIFTCRKDSFGAVQFDTNHYNHIVWENAEELRSGLRNRILALIGAGPGGASPQ